MEENKKSTTKYMEKIELEDFNNIHLKLHGFINNPQGNSTLKNSNNEHDLLNHLLSQYFSKADKTQLFMKLGQLPIQIKKPSLIIFTCLALGCRYLDHTYGYKAQLLEEYFMDQCKKQVPHQLSIILNNEETTVNMDTLNTFKGFTLLSLLEMVRYCDTSSMMIAEYAFRLSHTIGICNLFNYGWDVVACFDFLLFNMKYFALIFDNIPLIRDVSIASDTYNTCLKKCSQTNLSKIQHHLKALEYNNLCPAPMVRILNYAYDYCSQNIGVSQQGNLSKYPKEAYFYNELETELENWFNSIQPLPELEWYPFFYNWLEGKLEPKQLLIYDYITIYELSIIFLNWPSIGLLEINSNLNSNQEKILLYVADSIYTKIDTFCKMVEKRNKLNNIRSPFSIALPLLITRVYLNSIYKMDKNSLYYKTILKRVDQIYHWIQIKLGWEDVKGVLSSLDQIRTHYLGNTSNV